MDRHQWELRFERRLINAGLTRTEAQGVFDAGQGLWDYNRDNPEDEADAELSYMASDG